MSSSNHEALLAAVGDLLPQVRDAAERTEAGRRLPADLVELFRNAGLFQMCVPRQLGGCEISPENLVRVIEAVSSADASAGWCAMIAATSGVITAYMPPAAAAGLGRSAQTIFGGVFAPHGRAVRCADGYQVSGRWPFASGCQHCTWLMGGSIVLVDGQPRMLADGLPDARLMLFPASVATIHDTWDVSGLRGSGSHDIAVQDVFVPDSHAVSLTHDRPTAAGALYAFPVFGLLAIGIAAVSLGVARRAIDELTALATLKKPMGSRRRLAERPLVQAQVAQAEAQLRGVRALLFETIGQMWQLAESRATIGLRDRALLRVATTHATHAAARVVDEMYTAAGGTAIYASHPLQRCLRDIHVATQHAMVAAPVYELAGKVLLGLETDTSQL